MRLFRSLKYLLKRNKYIIIFLLLPVLVICMFLINGFLPLGVQLNRSDWLLFWGSVLAYIGTVFLGWLAIKQNKQIQNSNDDWQIKFFDIEKRTLELNQKLIELEESKHTPYIIVDEKKAFTIYLDPSNNEDFYIKNETETMLFKGSCNTDNGTIPYDICAIQFEIRNISKINIKDVFISSIGFQVNGSSFSVKYSRDCKHNNLLSDEQKTLIYIFRNHPDVNYETERMSIDLNERCLPIVNAQIVFKLIDFYGQEFEEKISISGPSIKKHSRYEGVYYTNISYKIIEKIKKVNY